MPPQDKKNAPPHDGVGELSFVVQKHAATRLHYDFRLELDGVLKSWAIPKGPSLDPALKRLAMHVEDHPYEYKDFEGTIPKGNYGAGDVIIWDKGSYRALNRDGSEGDEDALRKGYEKGDLKFILYGEKLKGEFALVRIKSADDNSWLLLKKKDQFATTEDITRDARSVVTERILEDRNRRGTPQRTDAKGEKAPAPSQTAPPHASPPPPAPPKPAPAMPSPPEPAPATPAPPEPAAAAPPSVTAGLPMPRQTKPMLASALKEPFDNPEWLFEIKLDGYRAVAEIENGDVRLYSRNNLSFNTKFSGVVETLRQLPGAAVLDGEVVVLDDRGRPSFQLVQNYERTGRGNLAYFAFDILYLNGQDLRELPLEERKEILRAFLPELPNVKYTDHVTEQGKTFFDIARQSELEGIIAKRRSSKYYTGRRTKEWLKIKIKQEQEAVICGFTDPRGSRRYFGALVLGVYEQEELVYIGLCGGGFDEKTLAEVDGQLRPLIRPSSPFRSSIGLTATWVEPRLVCEVSFTEWTDEGVMRHPIFIGMRVDRDPATVVRETEFLNVSEALQSAAEPEPATVPPPPEAKPAPTAPTMQENASEASPPFQGEGQGGDGVAPPPAKKIVGVLKGKDRQLEIGGRKLSLSNLDKLFWPDEGYTKGDVINYYMTVAKFILPHLKDRPESLYRTPEGINKPGFFQKDTGDLPPEWVGTQRIFSNSNDKYINFLLCQDEATLVYMANLGCIEINPWLSRVQSPDNPDFMVIDLDPEDIPFEKVVETALVVREVLDSMGITGYPKTSGATGIHIYIPLAAQYDYDTVTNFARLIATIANSKAPDFTSIVRSPAKRQQRVYLDFLQNRGGQTLAAPYSLRPRPGATVSTPLSWDEVKIGLSPSQFTISSVPARIERLGDLFAGVLGEGIDIAECIRKLEGG
ncbi:DNA ligase D [Geomonas sp. RF6]|uniref:DNA ligase D n=1 Tax=Geomonas sp. RF6 TaxID=2897342 RepID=UPI001E3D4891|nr:DNA ligase D [Geomonas sp. RF6]UFS71745.1 DNA ligase D [Geomonas sp. RF6]